MATKIFITPWIDLTDEEIRKCIKTGAHSARIHTGKLTADRINSLIDFYDQEQFRFYLDLRGNKASVNRIDKDLPEGMLKLGERVLVYGYDGSDENYFAPWSKKQREFWHCLGMNFLPQAVLKPVTGNFALDDGKVLLKIDRLVTAEDTVTALHNNAPYLECSVIKAGKVFPGDGVSSTDIFIHSGSDEPFSQQDIRILEMIPEVQKQKIKYFAISFVESARHIVSAQKVLTKLGYKDFQIVPKVETIIGIDHLPEICTQLTGDYGSKAEVQIGRGDLSLDCGRLHPEPDYQELTIKAVKICKQLGVKISVLALVLQSVRQRCKQDRNNQDMTSSPAELANILTLKNLGIYQLGLTNDMYIDQPEGMIQELKILLKK